MIMDMAALMIEFVVIILAAGVGREAMSLMRRLRKDKRPTRRRIVEGEMEGLIATLFTMVTLLLLSFVTVVYLISGLTPHDAIIRMGLNLPTNTNRMMLLLGTGLQAILKLYAMNKLLEGMENIHFNYLKENQDGQEDNPHDPTRERNLGRRTTDQPGA